MLNNFTVNQASKELLKHLHYIYICIYRYIYICEKNEMGGSCGAYGEKRGVHRVLVGKPEGKRSLERPRRRWEDNIKMDLQEIGVGFGAG
jgi:hypothetical protein